MEARASTNILQKMKEKESRNFRRCGSADKRLLPADSSSLSLSLSLSPSRLVPYARARSGLLRRESDGSGVVFGLGGLDTGALPWGGGWLGGRQRAKRTRGLVGPALPRLLLLENLAAPPASPSRCRCRCASGHADLPVTPRKAPPASPSRCRCRCASGHADLPVAPRKAPPASPSRRRRASGRVGLPVAPRKAPAASPSHRRRASGRVGLPVAPRKAPPPSLSRRRQARAPPPKACRRAPPPFPCSPTNPGHGECGS
ncbi:uncharacterized protein LOC133931006 [Phragmites australis]|uniref:uncharacterized protein LOC133931006 n=1 Tax=Phragmites australis TaxID=29695 RepID=UPI002D794E51|nr:uncharacterized protein LOC133931006 [Phragmites australis]